MYSNDILSSITYFTYREQRKAIPANLRPIYRITQILLVLKINSRNNKASFFKIQFFNWLLKHSSNEINERFLEQPEIFVINRIRIDPMVNLAINYALADDLITISENSKYQLTEKGSAFVENIIQENLILKDEIKLLNRIGKRISETSLRKDLK